MEISTFTDASIKEIPRFITALFLLAAAWLAGHRLTARWNIYQKRKEFDLATARDFHNLYGEFFAIWKLWNCYVRDIGPHLLPGASRWDIMKRACEAEGKLESIFVRLSCEKPLSRENIEALAKFRQLYQQLRESIRENQPLPWSSSQHPDYIAFKKLAPSVASLIMGEIPSLELPRDSSEILIEITSNKWENRSQS